MPRSGARASARFTVRIGNDCRQHWNRIQRDFVTACVPAGDDEGLTATVYFSRYFTTASVRV
jgi:hypothetical protein